MKIFKQKNWIVTIVVIIFSAVCCDCATESNCLDGVRSLFKRYQAMPDSLSTYYMNYSLTTIIRKKANNIIRNDIELTYNKEKMVLYSSLMDCFQDTSSSYMILKNEKIIYINDTKKIADPMQRMNLFSSMQDSLLDNSQLVACDSVVDSDNEMNHRVKLRVFNKSLPKFNEAVIEFLMKNDTAFSKMAIDFSEKSEISRLTMNINAVDMHYDWAKKGDGIHLFVYDFEGKLLEKYRDYKIIDN